MQGRAFLDLAHEVVVGSTETHWRGAAIHAYYALFLECRDILGRWGIPFSPRPNVHAAVRLRFTYAADPDPKDIGFILDKLVQLRNQASYDLSSALSLQLFASSAKALAAIQASSNAIALLDAIEADPARRAAAIASFPP
jgi:hypothetical protein